MTVEHEDAVNRKHLADSLAEHFGVRLDDFPGLAEAFLERYAALREAAPESSAEAFRAVAGLDLTDEDSVVVRETARGLLAEVRYAFEEDEDDDESSYLTVLIPADAVDRVRMALEGDAELRRRAALRRERDSYLSGHAGPWNLLAEPAEVSQARKAVESAQATVRRTAHGVQPAHDFAETERRVQAALSSGDPAPVGVRNLRGTGWRDQISVQGAMDAEREFTKATARANEMTAAMREAEALPVGPLRDFLLAEREERFYWSATGKGRKARQVKHAYRPTSEFLQEHKAALDKLASATERVQKVRDALAVMRQEHAESLADHEANLARLSEAQTALMSLGLPAGMAVPQRRSAADTDSPWLA